MDEEFRPHVLSRCLADVAPEEIQWLWPARFPRGKITLLYGDPGLGKSFLMLDVAARLSKGTAWPDSRDVKTAAGTSVILSAEDDLHDTIRPRLDAAGADSARIHAIEGVKRQETDDGCYFNLSIDRRSLEHEIEKHKADLLIIDPISAYMGDGADGNSNTDVRGILGPLSSLAMRQMVAVVVVTHLNKQAAGRALYRSIGSIAFTAAARMSWMVCKDPDDEHRRLFLPTKTNIVEAPTGLGFQIVDGAVHWFDGPVTLDPDEALASNGSDHSQSAEACDWLEEMLALGPVKVSKIRKGAEAECIAWRTLERAKKTLGVKAIRDGSAWSWEIQGRQGGNGKVPF